MAEEEAKSPVSAEVPPKVNPLGKPIGGTVKLNPMIRKPGIGGTPTAALKPGLKLPPKPATPAAGAATATLKPGLKLPTQTLVRPGLKLPTKPVIRKPGEGSAVKPLPKPIVAAPAAEAAPAASAAPAAPAPTPIDAQGVGKLPTVEAKAIDREAPAPVVPDAPKPMEALKSVTQKLKGITQQIPQQAILRKTGIIADNSLSEAQKEAAKHKTARISLSDAIGVAPVKSENAPMKTIRIKRPTEVPGKPAPLASAAPAAAVSETPAAEPAAHKPLKLTRPGGAHPTAKFGIKRPTAAAPATTGGAAQPAPVADAPVSDIPELMAIPDMPVSVPAASDGPAWLVTLSTVVQIAACAAVGALVWFLFQNTQTCYF